jgi:hypothetical protein
MMIATTLVSKAFASGLIYHSYCLYIQVILLQMHVRYVVSDMMFMHGMNKVTL